VNRSLNVSVIIPCYNSEAFIERTIRSVIEQTYQYIEIIAVDDGSKDRTCVVLNKLKNRFNFLQIYYQENKGACAARNFGFRNSCGKYILYLDADDIIDFNNLKHQVNQLENSEPDTISMGSWDRFTERIEDASFPIRLLDKDWDKPIDWLVNAWEGKGMAQTSVWLTPRHLIEKAGPWDERLKVNQDGEFFSRVLLQAKAIKFCPGAKVYYRSEWGNTVSKILNEDKASSLLLSYRLYKENILPHEDSMRVRNALMLNFLSFIYRFNGKYPELANQAREEIKALGFNKLPTYGGRHFQKLARIIGLEGALKLRKVVSGY
jgi:glycosyltransferase involved in cell wall biosynthesis